MAEHDPSYKLLFSHRRMIADLIHGFVQEDWVCGLDFDTLERVSEIHVSQETEDFTNANGELERRRRPRRAGNCG